MFEKNAGSRDVCSSQSLTRLSRHSAKRPNVAPCACIRLFAAGKRRAADAIAMLLLLCCSLLSHAGVG